MDVLFSTTPVSVYTCKSCHRSTFDIKSKDLRVGDLDGLLRSGIDHRVATLGVLSSAKKLLLAVGTLLLLLGQVAKSAAPCLGQVGETVTLEVVLATNIGALHGLRDAVETDAGGGKEKQARGVDWLVSLKGAILAVTMMNLAEGHTWAAVGDEAGVNWVAAAKEGLAPFLGVHTALGVDDLAGIAKNVVESVLPVLDIVVVDWTRLGRVGRVLINWGGHFV